VSADIWKIIFKVLSKLRNNTLHFTAGSHLFIVVIGCFCILTCEYVFPAWLSATENSYEFDVTRAAQDGDAEAEFALALLYEYGGDTIKRDPDQSILWLEKAGKKEVTAACLYLGLKYEYGNRVKKDLTKAACWYRCAARKNWPQAQYFLAGLYEHGKGVEKSLFMSLAWLGLAAEQDYPGAATDFSRLSKREGRNDLVELREKQKELLEKVGTPCN